VVLEHAACPDDAYFDCHKYEVLEGRLLLGLLLGLVEGGVEGDLVGREGQLLDEGAGFGRAMETVHAAIFPLNGERTSIANIVEGDDDILEADIAAADGAEIPRAPGVAEIGVATEYANGAVTVAPPDVLHVGVVDLLAEGADELHVVDALVAEVARVIIKAEALVVTNGLKGALGRSDVEGDFGRVYFEREVDVLLFKGRQDRLPALSEVIVALLQESLVGRREGVERVPDGRTREAVNDDLAGTLRLLGHVGLAGIEKFAGRLGGQRHFLGGTLTDAFRLTVAPHMRGENGLVTFVDVVAGGLAYEVRRNGPATEVVLSEQRPEGFDVALFLQRTGDVEVVAPTGELNAFVAHGFDLGEEFGDREVGPLAGEESNGALGHGRRDWGPMSQPIAPLCSSGQYRKPLETAYLAKAWASSASKASYAPRRLVSGET